MTGDTRVRQDRLTAENIAGRDLYVQEARKTQMGHLIDKFKSEIEKPSMQVVIDALNHYLEPTGNGEVKDLATKLSEGGRSDQIMAAELDKEFAAKMIMERTFSDTAQRILVLLLGELCENFRFKVAPLIKAGSSRDVVDAAIKNEVIDPAVNFLEQNVLEIYHRDLRAMLYYLTGNCHIEWRA